MSDTDDDPKHFHRAPEINTPREERLIRERESERIRGDALYEALATVLGWTRADKLAMPYIPAYRNRHEQIQRILSLWARKDRPAPMDPDNGKSRL